MKFAWRFLLAPALILPPAVQAAPTTASAAGGCSQQCWRAILLAVAKLQRNPWDGARPQPGRGAEKSFCFSAGLGGTWGQRSGVCLREIIRERKSL